MTDGPSLAVIVAVKDAEANLPAILANLAPQDHPDVEFIFCVAGTGVASRDLPASARLAHAASESLIPHLWRDGIRLARAKSVALTTAHCIPAPDWIERLKQADTARWPGIGGVIDNDPAASAANWAIFFLRYSAFAPPRPAGEVEEIAADNAVYSRAHVIEHEDLLAAGFWEPSFHRRFREAGMSLRLDPAMLVVHHGLGSPGRFIKHRYAHGREYGSARAIAKPLGTRLMLLAASPLVPAITVARIVRRVIARPRYAGAFLRSLPWLAAFVMAWTAGEVRGYIDALTRGTA